MEIPPLYYLMNFNDFPSCMVTLFHIMIVNNWYITCNMFVLVKGNNWPRCFFVAFWVIVVLIMLNLVISFILEIYSETEEDQKKKYS
jgi:two pore calcium channel protein